MARRGTAPSVERPITASTTPRVPSVDPLSTTITSYLTGSFGSFGYSGGADSPAWRVTMTFNRRSERQRRCRNPRKLPSKRRSRRVTPQHQRMATTLNNAEHGWSRPGLVRSWTTSLAHAEGWRTRCSGGTCARRTPARAASPAVRRNGPTRSRGAQRRGDGRRQLRERRRAPPPGSGRSIERAGSGLPGT